MPTQIGPGILFVMGKRSKSCRSDYKSSHSKIRAFSTNVNSVGDMNPWHFEVANGLVVSQAPVLPEYVAGAEFSLLDTKRT